MKKTFLVAMMLGFTTAAAGADLDKLIEAACAKGLPWRLPPPPPKFSTVEAPVKLDGASNRMVVICNCTPNSAGQNTGVWIRSSYSDEMLKAAGQPQQRATQSRSGTVAHYLPGRSCVQAGTPTLVLAPASDEKFERWGTFELEPK